MIDPVVFLWGAGLLSVVSTVAGLMASRHTIPGSKTPFWLPFVFRPKSSFTSIGWRYRTYSQWLLWPAAGCVLAYGLLR